MMKRATAFSSNAAGTVVKDGSTRAAAQARYRLRPSRIVDSSHESVIGCVRPCARTSATSWSNSSPSISGKALASGWTWYGP